MIESLESRRLLSASLLRNGLLNITGTSGSDTVVLTVEDVKEFQTSGGGFLLIPYVVVTTNGTEDGRFSTLKIRRIFADLGDGNDSYTVPYSLQFQQYVLGGNGNDTLVGGRNRDALDGGPGDDSMTGGRGDDILGSAAGGDTMVGGLGFDTVDMHRRTAAVNLTMDGVANDGASGETGDLANDIETILGGSGADLIDCGGFATTTDLLTGFVQGVTINGNNGHNTLLGSQGDDLIIGGSHSDTLRGRGGNDVLEGHRGRDRFFGDSGADVILSGDDNERDTVYSIGSDDDISQVDFLDVLQNDTISGTVYEDANGNGTRDGGELGLAGRTVYIDQNNNNTLDSGERSTTTGIVGNYTFTFLSRGTYTIRTVLPSGWTQTQPADGAPITLTIGDATSLGGQDFGEQQI